MLKIIFLTGAYLFLPNFAYARYNNWQGESTGDGIYFGYFLIVFFGVLYIHERFEKSKKDGIDALILCSVAGALFLLIPELAIFVGAGLILLLMIGAIMNAFR